ncbi:MAG: DNA-processing protein DprA [Myxococcota bacterium]
MNTAEKRATAALWSIRGVGPVTLGEVRSRLGPLGELLERPVPEWAPLVPWRADAGAHVREVASLAAQADRLEQQCARLGMEIVFPDDEAWPSKLAQIRNAPPLLFVRGPGARAPRRSRLAIVGTRTPPPGTAQRAADLAVQVAQAGVGVVSGAAIGIDQAAHRGALTAQGETWAFMGAALDQIDSPQRAIVHEMLDAGQTLFSEFPPGFRSNLNSFKLRNRLIAGASDAVLIFRAGPTSGALHTAADALEQGRVVLAAPGDPWVEAARGSNRLLRDQRVRPYVDFSDITAALGLDQTISPPEPRVIDPSAISTPGSAVLNVLNDGSCDFEELLERLPDMNSGQLSAALLELEVFGAVLHKGGRRYEKR